MTPLKLTTYYFTITKRFRHTLNLLPFLLPILLPAQQPRLVVPTGHTYKISSVAFSPDGRYALTAGFDGAAILWNLNGQELHRFIGHNGPVNAAVFSPDGQFILTGSDDGMALLWTLDGQLRQKFRKHTDQVSAVAFSPDGQSILTGSHDGTAILWTLDGQVLRQFKGHQQAVSAVAFSKNGDILTGSFDGTAILWDYAGKIIQQFKGHTDEVLSVALSPDAKYILTGSHESHVRLWDRQGKTITIFKGPHNEYKAVAFSPDGKNILTGSGDGVAILWNLDGKPIRQFKGHAYEVHAVAFSPDGQYVFTGGLDDTAKLWDINGTLRQSFQGHTSRVWSATFSPDGQYLLTTNFHDHASVKLWNLDGQFIRELKGHIDSLDIPTAAFSLDGNFIVTGSQDGTAKLWNIEGELLQTLEGHTDYIRAVAFSPDSQHILTGSYDHTFKLWNLNGQLLRDFKWDKYKIYAVAFSPDGKYILSAGNKANTGKVKLWNLAGEVVREFKGLPHNIYSVAFSPDGQHILAGGGTPEVGAAQLWKLNGQLTQSFEGHTKAVLSVAFSPKKSKVKHILTGSADGTAKLWGLNGSLRHEFKGHTLEVTAVNFSPDGKYILTGSEDSRINLWSVEKGEGIASLLQVDSADWVITTPTGLFDAPPKAMDLMHYVVSTEKAPELIGLEQLKARYYEPGLLSKLLGFSKEAIRPVDKLETVDLYPEIVVAKMDENNHLQIHLKERKGGIGRVNIFLNGKEVEKEANPLPRGNNAKRDTTIHFDLKPYHRLLLKHPDSTNVISIRVYNEAGWLKSQAVEVPYQFVQPQSLPNRMADKPVAWQASYEPKLYVVSIGTSDYTGEKLDLQYADQDARSMATALHASAAELFNAEGDSVQVYCLTTDTSNLVGPAIQWQFASKPNIKAIFAQISQQAKAEDLLIVYLSGHGITYGSAEQAQFHYLTYGVSSADLSDSYLRDAYTLSSEELTNWINAVPALKQVLIIDACSSGQVLANLAEGSKNLNANQIRALDRMKDRTGMFVISGSASNKVSYEASQYGQGLLTFSLLQGMKLVAASNNSYVDVMKLFQYSRDKVPELAKGIGGIQSPMLAFPSDGSSFDIGIVNKNVDIPIAMVKPVFIRNTFQDENAFDDVLDLGQRVGDYFIKSSSRGAKAPYIYVDVNQYENAYSLKGRYTINGEKVSVRGALFKGNKNEGTFELSGSRNELDQLVREMIRKVREMIR